MGFAFDEEQVALQTSARRFLEARSAEAAVRDAMASELGWSQDVWREASTELGWASLIIPEAHGGAELGFIELAALMEEMGRALFCGPYLSTIAFGANALLVAGGDVAAAHLPAIAAGERTATFAWLDGEAPLVAERSSGQWSLRGVKRFVLDGHAAELVIVEATTDAGPRLFAVNGAQIDRRPLETMDQTRRLADLRFDDVRIGDETLVADSSAEVREAILDRAAIALAAEQVGGAEACLDLAVEYAKVREQFGRPIGSFQAVKHICANMLLEVESARSAAYYAAWAVDHAPSEVAKAAAMARIMCTEAFFKCAGDSIQVHGGIGFTWEHPAHLYFKRARASSAFLGSTTPSRDHLARQLGLQ